MAYTPHVLFAMLGSWIGDEEEVWECTVRLSADGGGGDTLDPEAYLAQIKTPLQTWFAAATTHISQFATLNTIKVNHVDAAGHYVDPITHLRDYTPPIQGSDVTPWPGKTSLVYTWETGLARGPGHRGRIYPPANNPGGVSAFRCDPTVATRNAQNGAGLLAVLKNTAFAVAGTHGQPVVASKIGGVINNITGCTSDNVYDSQRRRGNRIPTARSAVVAYA